MAKVTIKTIENLDNPPTAVAQLNFNFVALQQIIDTLLSRDGKVPNSMLAVLDMNNNRILNLPFPVSPTEPARHGDIQQYVDQAREWAEESEASAVESEASAVRSEAAAVLSEAALDEFTDLYLGSFESDPLLDNDGDPIQEGALYWNSDILQFRAYTIQPVMVLTDDVKVNSLRVIVGRWFSLPMTALRSLSDVDADAITDDQILQWNTAQEVFLPIDLSAENVSFDDAASQTGGTNVQTAVDALVDRTSLGAYDISFFIQNQMENNERLFQIVAVRDFTLPVSLPNAQAKTRVAPIADSVILLKKNGTQIGTVTFAAAATTGTFSLPGTTVFHAGDILEITGPATADTAMRDTVITITARR